MQPPSLPNPNSGFNAENTNFNQKLQNLTKKGKRLISRKEIGYFSEAKCHQLS